MSTLGKLLKKASPQPGKTICILSGSGGVVVGTNDRSALSPYWFKTHRGTSSRHAEEHALYLARRFEVGELKTAVVLRYGRSGLLRMAKPCKTCQSKLEDAGVFEIHYSDTDGVIMEAVCSPRS